eukprot:gene11605-34309_t
MQFSHRRRYTGSGMAGYVDDTLFGSTKLPSIKQRATSADKSNPAIKTGRTLAGRNSASDIVHVTQRDLERMLRPSPILTADEVVAAKRAQDEKREAAQAVSKARKERMMRLEEEAKKNAPITDTERLKNQQQSATRSRATKLLEEERDQVKNMNQMMLYSKCVTIRDAQIEEKRLLMQENEDETRKQDMMMEIDRICALEQYEARESARHDERRRGAKVLEEQIHERERYRLMQEEIRDQERITMLREVERLKEEELQVQLEKKLRGKQLMEEVAAANAEQIRRKEMMKVREVQEDVKIQTYVKRKMLKEQEIQFEKDRIAHEKEMETARLRALQEKAADKQSELDELRARRYQEAKEREWRTKEKAMVDRQVAMGAELSDARAAQQNAILKQRADMARVERDEFVRVVTVNKAKEHDDMVMTVAKQDINHRYKEDLLTQIKVREERTKKDRQAFLEDGARLRAEAEAERRRLLEIKAAKLDELAESGVPQKYRAELAKMKIMPH